MPKKRCIIIDIVTNTGAKVDIFPHMTMKKENYLLTLSFFNKERTEGTDLTENDSVIPIS